MLATNKELDVLIKIEHLIMSENRVKMFEMLDKEGKCYFNDELITTDDINNYYNFIDNIIKKKKEKAQKQNEWNKKNIEYDRITNKITYYKKKNNNEKVDYWREQLELYKQNKGV